MLESRIIYLKTDLEKTINGESFVEVLKSMTIVQHILVVLNPSSKPLKPC